MKKYISVILMLLCMMLPVGCRTDMNYITENKPHITGVVKEISDDSLLIENESGVYSVSLEAEYSDSMTHFSIGDEVKVYYDGNIAESYPMQIKKVYVITLNNPE